MKKRITFLLLGLFVSSFACQFLLPSRTGMVISNCADIVAAIGNIQPGEVPQNLFDTGIKRGDEFDANQYFDVLTHVSMREGYALDYVYQSDSLGGFPLLYARPTDLAPYTSIADVPEAMQASDFREYLEIEDVEQGYFEYVVMNIMPNQFYLVWHANYNDTEIVCNREEVNDIISGINSDNFGNKLDIAQQAKARAMRNIEPIVNLAGDVATVQVITFTKWGGFYRETYTISREFPHTVIDIKQENVVPYDCGVMF